MATYELRNQQTDKLIKRVDGPISAALSVAFSQMDTDFPISIWCVYGKEPVPVYWCTLIMNSDPKLGN